jgi:hypothetical protein
MTVIDRSAMPVRGNHVEAPTVALRPADGPSGRHARPEAPAPVATPFPIAVPMPRQGYGPAGSGPIPVAPAALTAGAVTGPPSRIAEAFGPAALDQIPGPVLRHPKIFLAALVAFVVVAITMIVNAVIPATIDVHGSVLHLDSSSPMRAGVSCHSASLAAGTPIQITDASGTVLAAGTLDTGIAMVDSGSLYGREGYATACAYSFTVSGVPSGKSAYGIEIGGVPNRLTFSEQELRDGPGLHNGA